MVPLLAVGCGSDLIELKGKKACGCFDKRLRYADIDISYGEDIIRVWCEGSAVGLSDTLLINKESYINCNSKI